MKYEYWYANLKLSCKRKQEIRKVLKSAEELYYIEESVLRNHLSEAETKLILQSIKEWKIDEEYQKLEKKGVGFVTILDENYPKRLRNISSPPYALYLKGSLPKEDCLTAAIVGARECSPYGESMAREFAKELSRAGIQIVSGMARGVDSAAQKGALEVGGTSFGVLGCGVDICYPREEIGLYMDLQERGCVLSEFPIGTPPLPQNFPARNRIISGLADVVLLMEAKEKSGSLITVDMALEQGKDVYALPGPINSRLSKGCNELLKQGAGMLLSPKEFLKELGLNDKQIDKKINSKKIILETEEKLVYSCLGLNPKNLESILKETKLPAARLLDVLVRLELMGVVKELSKNYYVAIVEDL